MNRFKRLVLDPLSPKCWLHYNQLLSAFRMPITLDEAINKHLEKERKCLNPLYSAVLVKHTKLHIRIFELTPRNLREIEKRIAIKKKAKQQEMDAIKTQYLSTEIEALQYLRMLIKMQENGESLDEVSL